jgi:hypothetical protein
VGNKEDMSREDERKRERGEKIKRIKSFTSVLMAHRM